MHANQRPVEEEMDERIMDMGGPRFTETDLRALALEHAVQMRGPSDKASGASVVERAEKFLLFLKGEATRPA